MIELKNIEEFLNNYLNIGDFSGDSAVNGLNIEGKQKVEKIAFGVSCNMELFKKANSWGADMIVTHHPLLKKDSFDEGIKGINKDRIKYLLENEISLLSYHLPLDFHKEVGNNVSILKKLDAKFIRQSGGFSGLDCVFSIGEFEKQVSIKSFLKDVSGILGQKPQTALYGKKKIKTIAVTSGKGSSIPLIQQLPKEKIDLYLTGEISEQIPPASKEMKINYVAGGHYATETFGVKELAKRLKKEFKIETKFISVKVPY